MAAVPPPLPVVAPQTTMQQQPPQQPSIRIAAPDARLGPAAPVVQAFEFLCRYNSMYTDADHPDQLTAYHCVAEPNVSLQRYLGRFAQQAEWDPEGVILGLRVAGRFAAFSNMKLSILCAHRLTAAAGVLAVKAHSDKFRSNRTVARVGGMLLPELNGLELETFKGVGYCAVVYEYEAAHMLDRAAMCLAAAGNGFEREAAALAEQAFCGEAPRPVVDAGAQQRLAEGPQWTATAYQAIPVAAGGWVDPAATASQVSGSTWQASQSGTSIHAAEHRFRERMMPLWHPSVDSQGDVATSAPESAQSLRPVGPIATAGPPPLAAPLSGFSPELKR